MQLKSSSAGLCDVNKQANAGIALFDAGNSEDTTSDRPECCLIVQTGKITIIK